MSFVNQYKQVLKLQVFRIMGTIVVLTVGLIIISLGIAIGFTYLYSDADPSSILFLATGAPTIVIIMTGLVMLPNQVTDGRLEGHGEFLKTLPVNRAAIIVADTTIWLIATIPGIVVSTMVTNAFFRPGFSVSLWFIPAYILCTLTCIGVGYGYSNAVHPMFAKTLSMVLSFIIIMFSPINFPMSRLPGWLQVVHTILPIDGMAQIMRASLASTTFTVGALTIVKTAIWCLAGYTISIRVLNKQ